MGDTEQTNISTPPAETAQAAQPPATAPTPPPPAEKPDYASAYAKVMAAAEAAEAEATAAPTAEPTGTDQAAEPEAKTEPAAKASALDKLDAKDRTALGQAFGKDLSGFAKLPDEAIQHAVQMAKAAMANINRKWNRNPNGQFAPKDADTDAAGDPAASEQQQQTQTEPNTHPQETASSQQTPTANPFEPMRLFASDAEALAFDETFGGSELAKPAKDALNRIVNELNARIQSLARVQMASFQQLSPLVQDRQERVFASTLESVGKGQVPDSPELREEFHALLTANAGRAGYTPAKAMRAAIAAVMEQDPLTPSRSLADGAARVRAGQPVIPAGQRQQPTALNGRDLYRYAYRRIAQGKTGQEVAAELSGVE